MNSTEHTAGGYVLLNTISIIVYMIKQFVLLFLKNANNNKPSLKNNQVFFLYIFFLLAERMLVGEENIDKHGLAA